MIPVISLEELVKTREQYLVVIAIKDTAISREVKKQLTAQGIEISDIERVLRTSSDFVRMNREYIALYHNDEMEDYFEKAENEYSIQIFWSQESRFYQLFRKLNLGRVVELACGRGRHVPQYIDSSGEVILVDILDKNIEFCRRRFKDQDKINYYVNNGYDMSELEDNSCTALFTYDAMVHFELMDIFQYLKETYRILKQGGKALFHHSNNTEDYRITFATGTNGRNYMSKDLFAYLSNRSGLTVLEQKLIDWNVPGLDCITLVEKEAREVN